MLQNKIYQNFLIEIFKSFFLILFALSLIAITIRAVSFLDLIVDNGTRKHVFFLLLIKFVWNYPKIYRSIFYFISQDIHYKTH